LIKSIYDYNNNIEVVVMVNAPYNGSMCSTYKKDMLLFLSNYPNVYPHFCTEFRSLSKMWNNELIFASNNYVLILNDDVTLLPNIFNDVINFIKLNNLKSFKINGSWSHVLLNRNEINEVGWFDERLLGVGEEDGDMEFRWSKFYNDNFNTYFTNNILNHVDESADSNIKKHSSSKYSKFNRDFIEKKYRINFLNGRIYGMNEFPVVQNILDEKQYPYEKNYWKNKNML
jgi:predicted glycosyltransferase involved in capsule biosynthesis